MPKHSKPRRGSLGFVRKRTKRIYPRVNWLNEKEPGDVKILGFAGWKAGMTHVQYIDNRAKAITKGKRITEPVTIIDAPDLLVVGVRYYNNNRVVAEEWAEKLPDFISKKLKNPKSSKSIPDADNVRLIISSQPSKSGMHKKKPEIIEIGMTGDIEKKILKAKELMGKELSFENVFEKGNYVDVIGVTKGKGFQGVVKRFGVKERQRKVEQSHRHVGSIGGVVPRRVLWQTPQAGQLGFFKRTELNKRVIDFGKGEEITPKNGFGNYGVIPEKYIMIEGSIPAAKKRFVVMRIASRTDKKIPVEIVNVSK